MEKLRWKEQLEQAAKARERERVMIEVLAVDIEDSCAFINVLLNGNCLWHWLSRFKSDDETNFRYFEVFSDRMHMR